MTDLQKAADALSAAAKAASTLEQLVSVAENAVRTAAQAVGAAQPGSAELPRLYRHVSGLAEVLAPVGPAVGTAAREVAKWADRARS